MELPPEPLNEVEPPAPEDDGPLEPAPGPLPGPVFAAPVFAAPVATASAPQR